MAYNFRSQMEAIAAAIPRLYYEIYQPIGDVDMVAYWSKEPVPFADSVISQIRFRRKKQP